MIERWKSSGERSDRDITAPRRDYNNRVSKPQRPSPQPARSARNANYTTEEEQARKFVAEEDNFVLRQSKKKADIRVREGRATPIDFLAFNLRFIDNERDVFDDEDADIEIEVPLPETVLEGLNIEELKEVDTGITSYITLEKNEKNRTYWKALQILCEDRRQRLRNQAPEARIVGTVASDIDKILAPKSHTQLEALEKQIRAKLQSNEPIDTDYWEQLLKSLQVWKARAALKTVYDEVVSSRAEQLRRIGPEKADSHQRQQSSAQLAQLKQNAVSQGFSAKTAASLVANDKSAPPPGTARFASNGNEDFSNATKALYDREVARGVDEDEEIFTAEEEVSGSVKPQWADKYRPRKPRYFNRVQMGYEWNKYNQTHYDHDNPPPKVVQGYKFNIFYPDLIDKTKAPTFKIVREGGRRRGESFKPAGEDDTCLIRFVAGPPYEDIAFRIVDREWDYSAKKERGFRSSFDKVSAVQLFMPLILYSLKLPV
jgi:hypothetical protein